jgi:uncharacterized protein (DUF1697 family)
MKPGIGVHRTFPLQPELNVRQFWVKSRILEVERAIPASMPIYVSMPRGINVGGHKKIKMEQLRVSLEKLGMERVKTYIQSGNIVFRSKSTSTAAVSKTIEAAILQDFGHTVSVITRTYDEIRNTTKCNPFLRQSGTDLEKLHVMFLSDAPAPTALKQLQALITSPEQCQCIGKELFFYLPNGVGNSVLMKKPVDRILGVVTTMRNWRTVNTLHQMCVDCE